MSTDTQLRRLERQAASGDNEAEMRLMQYERLAGIGPKAFEADTQMKRCIRIRRRYYGWSDISGLWWADETQTYQSQVFVDTQMDSNPSYPVIAGNFQELHFFHMF